MANSKLLTFVAGIVSAHVSNNSVKSAELPPLIEAIYGSLEGLGEPAPFVKDERVPAVSIRSSVQADAITCLECGARQKMMKRHLATRHQLSPGDYKVRWSLNADYPLIARDYATTRRDIAVKSGLGRELGVKNKLAIKAAARATKLDDANQFPTIEAVAELTEA